MGASEDADWTLQFVLLPHQLELGHLISSGVRHPAIIAGAGSGKTKVLVNSAITLCAINQGLPMVLTEPTLEMVRDILEPAIEEACEQTIALDENGCIQLDENKQPVMIPRERKIPFRFWARSHTFYFPWWKSRIMCRSGEKPRRLRGPNLAAAGIDEVGDQKEEVLTTLQGRVRHPKASKRVVMACGTPRGYDWSYERWAEPGGKRRLKNAALVRAKSADNVIVTTADPEWLQSQKDTYDPELYRQEAEGEFVAIGQSSTYYAFSRDANLRHGLKFIPRTPSRPAIVCCDFNHSPLAFVILQSGSRDHCARCKAERMPHGRVCAAELHAWSALGELNGPKTTDAACDEIIRRYGEPGETKYQVYGSVNLTDKNYSDYEILRDRLRCTPYTTTTIHVVKDRTNSINGLLKNAAGASRLLIDEDSCPELAKDMEQTKYLPNSFDIDGSNDARTHWANALSFWAVLEHPVLAGRRGK